MKGSAVVFLVEESRGGAIIEKGRTMGSRSEASEEIA